MCFILQIADTNSKLFVTDFDGFSCQFVFFLTFKTEKSNTNTGGSLFLKTNNNRLVCIVTTKSTPGCTTIRRT